MVDASRSPPPVRQRCRRTGIGHTGVAIVTACPGFLIVEHNIAVLSRMVGHLYVLDRGQMLAEGVPGEVLKDAAVRDAYIGGRA